METVSIILIGVSVFWALNMGASGLGVAFSPSYGSGILGRGSAVALFTVFVLAGALLFGSRVAATLRSRIVPEELVSPEVAVILLVAAGASLFLANLIRIPQSTSIIIVGSFSGVGLYYGHLDYHLVGYMFLVWIAISFLAYFLTYFLARFLYPPRSSNFRFHEKLQRHKTGLRWLTVVTDCYGALGIGSNNVANVVGPLAAAGLFAPVTGFLIFAPLFGLGGLLLGKGVMETAGKEIVPLGLISSSIVSIVCSSLIITASVIGLPAPYVQVASMALLAMLTVKQELPHSMTLHQPIARKILKVWTLTPALALVVSYGLLWILGRVRPLLEHGAPGIN
ncbi:MAG: inorganic phosphate transporter [Spirochaetales bacterium]|nr:anion permease [Leptospiraceae bacterium]MCP5483853.1 inorganic phosphate transporter [Spirochaetales bacterium]MCP5486854.1 inorganic phosphate transporter [Spirochaetales bacterium]